MECGWRGVRAETAGAGLLKAAHRLRADLGHQAAAGRVAQPLRGAQVGELDVTKGIEQNVLKLQVTEDEALTVQVAQGQRHGGDVDFRRLFRNPVVAIAMQKERVEERAGALLEQEVHRAVVLPGHVKSHDKGVRWQRLKGAQLAKYQLSAKRPLHDAVFVKLLERKLRFAEVSATVDKSKASLADQRSLLQLAGRNCEPRRRVEAGLGVTEGCKAVRALHGAKAAKTAPLGIRPPTHNKQTKG